MMTTMTLEKFEEASEIVKRVTRPTKLIYSEYLSSQTGGKVYLKPENIQPVLQRPVRQQSISQTGEYAEDRRIQDQRCLL